MLVRDNRTSSANGSVRLRRQKSEDSESGLAVKFLMEIGLPKNTFRFESKGPLLFGHVILGT
jgi:hypothetical protein